MCLVCKFLNVHLTVIANDRQYIEIIKIFGNVHKNIKKLSDSLKEIKKIQLELLVWQENIADKGPVKDEVIKLGRLPKVLMVGKIN